MNKWKLFAVFVLLLAVCVFVHYYWLDGLSGAICELTLGRTVFAPAYSEYKYRNVRPGMKTTQVKAMLGDPLRVKSTNAPGEEVWFYTNPKIWDKSGLGGNCDYTERNLIMKNGVVASKHFEFYFD